MTVRDIAAELAAVPELAGLAPEHLDQIAGCGTLSGAQPGEYLFREDEHADVFHVIRHGKIALEVHAPHGLPLVVETLEDHALVGWSWLFEPYLWQFDARAVEPTRLLSFDGACLRGKCEANHELGYHLMKSFAAVMTERLQATRLRLLDVYGDVSR